jgi:hypothetical protein
MEHSFCFEARSNWAIQEILCLSWSPKVRYHGNKSQLPVSVWGQISSAHTQNPISRRIHFNIILPTTRRCPSGLFLQAFEPTFKWLIRTACRRFSAVEARSSLSVTVPVRD